MPHTPTAPATGKGKPGFFPPSFLNKDFDMTLPDELTLCRLFTGLFLLAVLYVTQLWITWSSRQIGTKSLKRLKCSKKPTYETALCAVVVSSCAGSSVSAPAPLMFEKMNGETEKRVSVGDNPHNDDGSWKIHGEMWKSKQILRVRGHQHDPCF